MTYSSDNVLCNGLMYIISITKKLFSEWNLIYNDPFLPAAELMGPSD